MPSGWIGEKAMAQSSRRRAIASVLSDSEMAEGHPEMLLREGTEREVVPKVPVEGHHDSGGKRNPEPCVGNGRRCGRQLAR